jgi:hypothetical protein
MKNKTLAAWLAFLGGPLGLHRFYLHGPRDLLGWLLPVPTVIGLYGVHRMRLYGLDDPWSWVLIPMLGFTIAGCALMAIIYGLMDREKWNARFNPQIAADSLAGGTNWFTIGAVVLSLMIGATVLMASIAFSFEHYFVYQVEEGRKISR